ncbi:hypothetical protein EON64_05960 [archaeon]|nr:MAG: hypothetical protein EON64_05960 [archaeon]
MCEQWRVFTTEHQHSKVHFDPESHYEPRAADYYESAACESLIGQLLAVDPRARPSISSVLLHPYLVQGFLPEHSQHMQLAHNIPQYDPASLYNISPPSWPTSSGNEGGGAEDIWKRRQFSSLWAPMPKDYNLHANDLPSVKVSITLCSQMYSAIA